MRKIAGLTLSLVLVSCRGCDEDKPYTPFGVTTALPAPNASASVAPTASASAASDPPPPSKALIAPKGARRWVIANREIAAPRGFVFSQAVTMGDGEGDLVAWVVSEGTDPATASSGELWFFPVAGGERKLAPLPGFVPSGPGCTHSAALAKTGNATVTLDVEGRCGTALIARSPVRAVQVIAPSSERPEVLTLRVAAPAPGEALDITSATSDRDQDGRDDVALSVRVGTSGPSAEVPLIWLDRAVGPSRDATEPRKSLERAASREVTRAKGKKTADDVLATVSALRRLIATLCAEGATPRIFAGDGSPLGCGSLAAVVDSLFSAEAWANLTLGRVREGFGVLLRDGWYFGKASAATRKRVEKELLDAIEPVTPVVRTLEAAAPSGPHQLGPLSFEPDGTLTVRTAAGIARFDRSGTAQPTEPTAAEVPLPSLDVRPGGRLFTGVVYSCDRSEVVLSFDSGAPTVTHLLSPRPGACGRAPFDARTTPRAVAAGTGLGVLLAGTLVGETGANTSPLTGSARSADGRWIVVSTPFGLLVDGPRHFLVGLRSEVDPMSLKNCTVANDGARVACTSAGGATMLMTWGG
jgi:hypothetical protein